MNDEMKRRKTVPITSAIIRQVITLEIELNGTKVRGTFTLESEWNGLMKLVCNSPIMHLIIKRPNHSHLNQFDKLHPIFGGNVANWMKDPQTLEIEAVAHSIDIGGVILEQSGPLKLASK